MKILLDTHCWLWSHFEPDKLGARAAAVLKDLGNEVFFSAASSWEIALKYKIGKLPDLPDIPERFLPPQLIADQIALLPIQSHHALRTATLPGHHNDPFDRLLIAQAQVEELVLMTADEDILPYRVRTLWAGRNKPSKRPL